MLRVLKNKKNGSWKYEKISRVYNSLTDREINKMLFWRQLNHLRLHIEWPCD
ncbi:hypothetical protein HMPREF0645_0670 [Hallella bergensis DSM 17361]|uniref:Uncharacterized protein n=1 Tax=Hallella bergensis DSM 17361 TaxID=585502 RepID=D1PUN5_9BACT|nr:hypothetical protein HMPREF0645_0670 [Hallella bergensis DSM 17361]